MTKIISRPYLIALAIYIVISIAVLAYARYGLNAVYSSKEFLHGTFIPDLILAIAIAVYCFYRQNTYSLPNPDRPLGWKLALLPLVPTLLLAAYALMSHASLSKAFFIPFIGMLAVAVAEELMFRKIVITSLLKEVTPGKAILISASIFSGFHSINIIAGHPLDALLIQLATTFLAGMYFGVLYMYTKNIGFVIVLHWLWNYTLVSGVIKPGSSLAIMPLLIQIVEIVTMIVIVYKYKEIRTKEYLAK